MSKDRYWPILIGAVALVKGHVKGDGPAMYALCRQYEVDQNYLKWLERLPFNTVHLIVRYGTEYSGPLLGRIDKRAMELSAAIEVPMDDLRELDEDGHYVYFEKLLLEVFVAVAEKYKVDGSEWQRRLDELT